MIYKDLIKNIIKEKRHWTRRGQYNYTRLSGEKNS